MKKNVKKVISFILSMLVIISTAVTPAMAAGTKEAPTEVKSVTASGLWTTVLNLEFEDTTWMDNINKVIVNDKECKKSTINSFSSDTNIWEVGSATGAYGSYKALKLAVPDGKLWTVKVSADGYKDLTVKITKETVNYTDTYKAEVVSNSGETTNKTSAFLQGATASKAKNKEAGKAIGDNIRVITSDRYIKDGEVSDNYGTDDALSGLYWKEGIDATPPLDKYVTSEVENILSLEGTLDKTYDGKAVNGPVVKAGDKVLAEETDYTLTYKDSEGNELSETPVNAGTYTVTVNGLGTYAGMNLNVTFTISPKAAELTVVADPSSAKYDGKSKTPEVTVKDGDKVLKEGTDYTLSYVYGEDAETKDFAGAEFVKEGNYTIIVTGIGNYERSTGKAVFTISKNNSASTDPTNPSNPNGDKNVTDKKVSNNTNNVKPVVKNVAAKNNKNVPKTGDNANVLLWIALAVISCGVLTGAGVAVRKRK